MVGQGRRAWTSPCGTPLVQEMINDQKLMEPTPSVAWTRVLLMRCNLRDTRGPPSGDLKRRWWYTSKGLPYPTKQS